MRFFFSEERRRKKERELEQQFCPHEYKTVAVIPENNRYYERYDMYCPLCEKLLENVSIRGRERLLNIQKEREAYWSTR